MNLCKKYYIIILPLIKNNFLIGLEKGECTEEDIEKVKSMVPKSLESYVERKYIYVYRTLYMRKFVCACMFVT